MSSVRVGWVVGFDYTSTKHVALERGNIMSIGLTNQKIEKQGHTVDILEETLSDGSKAYNLQIADSGARVELACDSYDTAIKIYRLIENHCD